ncbi:MAG: 2OG-Fe(II) oxygenase [Burkholderiales bacterium]|nr:2OG-Fe(II) oxygenase [Burkholderiales bacterium]
MSFISFLPEHDERQLVDALAETGIVVIDHFLSPDECARLRTRAQHLREAGAFQRAAIGRAQSRTVADDVRRDEVLWLNEHDSLSDEAPYWFRVNALMRAMNQALFLGLRYGEFHYAHYPEGGFYRRHLDRFRDDDARAISCVCYLNADWQAGDGGELRVWADAEGLGEMQDVAPQAGRLVLFRSEQFLHEVLPTRVERWSITGWMRRDG